MTHKKPMSPRAKDMKYVNKGEDYEVYYAKNHPTKRTGYKNVQHAEVGGTKKMSTTSTKPKSKAGFGKAKTKSTSVSSDSSSKTTSSIKSKSTSKFSLKKGSKVSSKTNYLPHRKIDSIETKGGKKINSSEFVDGLYVKKGIKFGTGGGINKGQENIIGFWLLNSPDGRKILRKSKKAEGDSAPSYSGFDNLKQNVIDYVLKNNAIKTPQGSVDYKVINKKMDWSYIFENTKNKMATGGGISSNTTYLPNRKIKQATTTSGKVISSKNFIDGIYVKGKTKFGKGGGVNKNEWRLPTKEEWENVLYPNKDLIPNLKIDDVYWSSSKVSYSSAWGYTFRNGGAYDYSKGYTTQVRAVRDISPNSANSANSTIIGNLEVWNKDLGKMTWDDAMEAVAKMNTKKMA